MVLSDINMPRMDGLYLARKAAGKRRTAVDRHRLGVWRHGEYPHRDEPRRVRFRDQADRLSPISKRPSPRRSATSEILREARRRQLAAERAHASLSRYFSPNLAERLACDADAIDLGGQRREIATLFTDIASFTTLVETLEPDVLEPLLNDYLTGMTEIVFAHDGTVAKIVGDALHVLFGAPGEQPDHATRAVVCALALDAYRARRSASAGATSGVALGATRIGVHAGPAIVGNFGGGRFFDYTAYGDTINVAARLEAANKQLGTSHLRQRTMSRHGRRLSSAARSAISAEGPIGADPRLRAAHARRNTPSPGPGPI